MIVIVNMLCTHVSLFSVREKVFRRNVKNDNALSIQFNLFNQTNIQHFLKILYIIRKGLTSITSVREVGRKKPFDIWHSLQVDISEYS